MPSSALKLRTGRGIATPTRGEDYLYTHSWEIAGTDLVIVRVPEEGVWSIYGAKTPAEDWVTRNDLAEASFPTRRELIATALALHAQDPMPSAARPDVRLTRVAPGRYATDDGWQIAKASPGGWQAWNPEIDSVSSPLQAVWWGTLFDVRRYIMELRPLRPS